MGGGQVARAVSFYSAVEEKTDPTVTQPHHPPQTRPIHISPANRFINPMWAPDLLWICLFFSATKMTGRPGHWSEPGEYNILFLGSILVISSQDSCALGYREFTQEGPMTISPFAAREGTSAPQWPNVKKCCRHLVLSSDFFVQSYAVPILPHRSKSTPFGG